ncbi:MAG: hypothetical protein QOI24_3793 [Acidobacteriota bacterium]|nr:hypothetical protein [Acidobacteriota bacterium]
MRRTVFAILFLLVTSSATLLAGEPQRLPQNWNASDWAWFYTTPQGSKLVPYKWALALERADSDALFLADGLARLHYLPSVKSSTNPDGLPVGFVRDTGRKLDHLGMTCAACHTNQLDYNGVTYQIDGAPTGADLFGFLAEMSESLSATCVSPTDPKFLRFAKRVLGGSAKASKRAELFTELKAFSHQFATFVMDTTPDQSWGLARADAFGAIFNRVTAIDLKIPSNNEPPNAPVSYPFLWDTSWHNVVQWNGSAPNRLAVLRLARNVGEVLGVFADIDIRKPSLFHLYYDSTAKRINLLEIEDRLATLRSPRWPAAFPALDQRKVDAGKAIYDQQCLSCHAIATPGVEQEVTMTPLADVGTDPAMVTVAANRMNKTGVLEGVRKYMIIGDKFGPTAGAGSITFNAVLGAILAPLSLEDLLAIERSRAAKTANASTSTRSAEGSEHDLRVDLKSASHEAGAKASADSATAKRDPVKFDLSEALSAQEPAPSGLAYKARPLDGIWATAPYLHNGSVPTLSDLLLPVAKRPSTFFVGSRDFDPVNVGFDSSAGDGRFKFDTTLDGNHNSGHTWGTTLSQADREALIEYMKSL